MIKKFSFLEPFFLPAVILISILSAVFRILELKYGYEDGLPIKNNIYAIVLISLCVIGVALIGLRYIATRKASDTNFKNMFLKKVSRVSSGLIVLSALVFFANAIYSFITWQNIEQGDLNYFLMLANSVLSLFVVFVLIKFAASFASGAPAGKYNIIAVITPVIWASVWLINVFRASSVNPVTSAYMYNVFYIISGLLSFFAFAAFIYKGASRARIYCCALISVFFSLIVISSLTAMLFEGDSYQVFLTRWMQTKPENIIEILSALGCLLFSSAILIKCKEKL